MALTIWPSHSSESPAPSPFTKSRPWRWKFGESMVCWVMWICEPLLRTLQTTADHFILNPCALKAVLTWGWIRISENGEEKAVTFTCTGATAWTLNPHYKCPPTAQHLLCGPGMLAIASISCVAREYHWSKV